MCPGLCVNNRISEFCEAALDVDLLCRQGVRCCVSADLFADVDDPPREFVLLNPKKPQNGGASQVSMDVRSLSLLSFIER